MSSVTPYSYSKKYLDSHIEERYQDASQRIYLQYMKQKSLRKPGDKQLGPYLTVANVKQQFEKQTAKSAVCVIL